MIRVEVDGLDPRPGSAGQRQRPQAGRVCRGRENVATGLRGTWYSPARLGTAINRYIFVTGVNCKKGNWLLVLTRFRDLLTSC